MKMTMIWDWWINPIPLEYIKIRPELPKFDRPPKFDGPRDVEPKIPGLV